MSGLAEAVVDLSALAHNVRLLARAMRPGALMAVVKADAFGHGAVPVARTALASGARWLGVATPTEALELRAAGVAAPLLCWLPGSRSEVAELARCGVDLSVGSEDDLRRAADAPAALDVHLKADTGLSRGGARPDAWRGLVELAADLQRAGRVRVRGLWSHLASSEDGPDSPAVHAQLAAFADALGTAAAAGLHPPLRHLANSAAVLGIPVSRLDLGRAGAAVYGIEPVPGEVFGLRPALTLRTRVALVKRVPAATGVSYRHGHVTDRETTLALVPIGYADGVPRGVGGRAEVLLAGQRRPVVGQICMDQCVVDAGDLPVAAGDPVVVFGPGDRGEPTVAEYAALAGTIPHEVLTGIGTRVPRRYVDGPQPQEEHRARPDREDPHRRAVRGAER